MTFTEAERETIDGISPKGLHMNQGTPCECGADAYNTITESAFSDSKIYDHECQECGNKFSTWTEG